MNARTHALTSRDLDMLQQQRDDADLMAWRDAVDSDLQHLDDTPVPPPIVRCAPKRPRNWIVRLWRAVVLHHLREQLACLEDERERYVDTGMAGPKFTAINAAQQRDLRSRIAFLESDL